MTRGREVSGACALSVRDLRVRFGSEAGGVQALRGIDLTLTAGRTLGLVGESGSGKSTAGLAIIGLLPPRARVEGSVRLGERELLGSSDAQLSRVRGAGIGMIFQDPAGALTPVHTVGAQVSEALTIHGAPRRAADRRALELLDLVGLPEPRRTGAAYPHELSGGQRQRVAIAIAVANEPAVVIADEPTTALDPTVQDQVLRVLRRTTRELGSALLLITHDLAVVAGMADEVAVLRDGRIVEHASVDRLYAHPAHDYTRRLLAATPRLDAPGPARASRVGEPALRVRGLTVDVAPRRIARQLVGGPSGRGPRPVRRWPPRPRGASPRRIVDHVDLEVAEGECLALVGESGAGKSSVLRAIMDLDPSRPDAGQVVLDGAALRDRADVRRRLYPAVQLIFQDAGAALDPRLSVAELVGEPLRVAGLPARARTPEVCRLLDLVGLESRLLDQFTAQLSGGQRQRVAIARALATTPRILLLDEPVSALDVCVQAEILDLLERLRTDLGLGFVIVAHDLALVRRIADRIAVMRDGRIVEAGTAEEVFAAPCHPHTRALLAAVPIPDPAAERARQAASPADGPPDDESAAPTAGTASRNLT